MNNFVIFDLSNNLTISIIVLVIALIILLVFAICIYRMKRTNYNRKFESRTQIKINIPEKSFYIYNLEFNDALTKRFLDTKNNYITIDEFEAKLTKKSFKKLIEILNAEPPQKKQSFSDDNEITLSFKASNFFDAKKILKLKLNYYEDNIIYADGKLLLNYDEIDINAIKQKINLLNPKTEIKTGETYFIETLNSDQINEYELIALNFDGLLDFFIDERKATGIKFEVCKKILRELYYLLDTDKLYWITGNWLLIFINPKEINYNKFKKNITKLIKKILKKNNVNNKTGIYTFYFSNTSLEIPKEKQPKQKTKSKSNSKNEIKLYIEFLNKKLSYFLEEVKERNDRNGYEFTFGEEENIRWHEFDQKTNQLYNKIFRKTKSTVTEHYKLIEIDTKKVVGVSSYQNKDILKIFSKNLFTKKQVDTIYSYLSSDIIENSKTNNKTKLYAFSIYSDFLINIPNKDLIDFLTKIKRKSWITIYWTNNYESYEKDLIILREKVNLIREIKSRGKSIFKIGFSKLHLVENNVPVIIKARPDYIVIDGVEMESLASDLSKMVILKQWEDILNSEENKKEDSETFFIIQNPIDENQILEIQNYNVKYIETKHEDWKDIYFPTKTND